MRVPASIFAIIVTLIAPGAVASADEDSSTSPPNIVVMNVDDHGMAGEAVWSRMATIRSLFIDRGISFVNYWNNFPLCCPGRATQLTGQEAHHHGVIVNDGSLFDPSVTLATELSDIGYTTLISGKYLNGTSNLADKTPPGWDHAAVSGGGYYRYTAWVDDVGQPHASAPEDYSTDVFADWSMTFLKAAPLGKPVFLYLNPYAVHEGPDENGVQTGVQPVPAPRHRGDARCADAPRHAPPNFNEADVSDKPLYIQRKPRLKVAGFPMVRVCETLLSVDEWLGRVVTELTDQGRMNNTLFVLTTDNGNAWGSNRWIKKIAPYSSQSLLFTTWTGVTAGEHTSEDALLSSVDLAPTLCEVAGCVMGPFANGFAVDGQSFAGLVAPEHFTSVPVRDGIILEHLGPSSQVPRWRGLITSPDGPYGQWFLIKYFEIGYTELYKLRGGNCLTWSVGQPGDPCMLNNRGHARNTRKLRPKLNALMTALW